jgi:hypothetical protein
MSADNGVYILRTPVDANIKENGYEYRVIETSGIDNIYFFFPNGNPTTIVDMFGRCQVLEDAGEAQEFAKKLADECMAGFGILEYGISTIEFDIPFSYYAEEAARGTGKVINKEIGDSMFEFVGVQMRNGAIKTSDHAKCFKCEKEMSTAMSGGDEETWVWPVGVVLTGGDNFGSSIYDAAMDGIMVQVVICDNCLKKHNTLFREVVDMRRTWGNNFSKVDKNV